MNPCKIKGMWLALILFCTAVTTIAQPNAIKWSADGNSYYKIESNEVNQYALPANIKTTVISASDLTPTGQSKALTVRAYAWSSDLSKALIYTISKRVWRSDTRGEYYVLDMKTKSLIKLGAVRPESYMILVKFPTDGTKVA